ncbi:MAG: sulfotransferase family protein [Thiobacillaceae bacterium]
MNTGPIFVVGMNGSGTTMLADCLGRHPHIYSMPRESKVLPYYLQHYGHAGALDTLEARRRLANRIGREKTYWQSNGKQNIVLRDEELGLPGFATVIDALYRKLMQGDSKRRWCDRSPINTQHIAALAQAFPDAQFLHIIRDGRDAAQSFHRRWGYHPLHTITRWKHVVREGCRQGAKLAAGRYMALYFYYEQLTARPADVMRAVCEFLNEPFDEAVLESSMYYMDAAAAEKSAGTIVENSGKWKSYFDDKTLQGMERIAGKTLIEHGYPARIDGDAEPQVVMQSLWKIRDRIGFTLHFFKQYGLGAAPMFARHLVAATKQWASTKF